MQMFSSFRQNFISSTANLKIFRIRNQQEPKFLIPRFVSREKSAILFSHLGFVVHRDSDNETSKIKFHLLKAVKQYLNKGTRVHGRKIATIRQFLTRLSTSDWFLAMLKISTEHGSRVPLGSYFGNRKQVENCSCYSS